MNELPALVTIAVVDSSPIKKCTRFQKASHMLNASWHEINSFEVLHSILLTPDMVKLTTTQYYVTS